MQECKNRAPGSLEWKDGERERFEKLASDWKLDVSKYDDGSYCDGKASLAWMFYQSRQPEIDALTSQLQDEMIQAAGQEAIVDTLKKLMALRDKNIDALTAENERLRKACSKAATWLAGNSIDDTAHESWRKTAKSLYEELRAAMTAPDTKGELE